jgi:UDPglucose 6-dehydrogenase
VGVRGALVKICVQGLWHLGSVTAAALSSMGHEVVGLDLDAAVLADLKNGKAPIFEPGVDTLLRTGIDTARLSFIDHPAKIPGDIELLWIAFDTPVNDEDVADVEFVIAQACAALPNLPKGCTVLVSSQLPVGSVRRLEVAAADLCPAKHLGFAVSPENLRLGRALDVFLNPDRVIVGTRQLRDRNRIIQMFKPIDARIEWMSVESAEMTKHAINAFLATSVVFANEIANLCELEGADAKEVERGLKSEHRIGPKAYLGPGSAFAGGTLARDIEFLKAISQRHQLPIPMLKSVKTSNDAHKHWLRRRLVALMPMLKDVPVTVWGLTYKAGTDTLRRSLAVELCEWLLDQGAKLMVHDPIVNALPDRWQGRVARSDDAVQAVRGSRVLIVGTEWPMYREVSVAQVTSASPGLLVLDANRFLSEWMGEPGLTHVAVGTPSRGGQS